MTSDIVLQSDQPTDIAFGRALRTLRLIGGSSLQAEETKQITGIIAGAGRPAEIKLIFESVGSGTLIRVQTSATEALPVTTNMALDRFVEAFKHTDNPNYKPALYANPDTLLLIAVLAAVFALPVIIIILFCCHIL